METFHEWEADGKRYRAVHDEDYTVDKSCGGRAGEHTKHCSSTELEKYKLAPNTGEEHPFLEGTQQEVCEAFYKQEVENLDRGVWVALGVIVSEPCAGVRLSTMDGPEFTHCECCSGTKETDSLWGIVIENSSEAAERFVREGGVVKEMRECLGCGGSGLGDRHRVSDGLCCPLYTECIDCPVCLGAGRVEAKAEREGCGGGCGDVARLPEGSQS